MKRKDTLMNGRILYSVDPRNLLIKVCNLSQINNGQEKSTTYENFSLDNESELQQLFKEKLPAFIKGLWYFRTQDEAQIFIKTQIGL